MKVQIEAGLPKEIHNLKFTVGTGTTVSAAFGDNDELVITLPNTGASGPQGNTGVTGTGSSLLFGTGVPATGVGINGDSYIAVDSGAHYKKAAGAWGAAQVTFTPA